MFGVDWSNPGTLLNNLANLALGIGVAMVFIAIVVRACAVVLRERRGRRSQVEKPSAARMRVDVVRIGRVAIREVRGQTGA